MRFICACWIQKKGYIVFGEGSADGLINTKIKIQAKYFIIFTRSGKKIVEAWNRRGATALKYAIHIKIINLK